MSKLTDNQRYQNISQLNTYLAEHTANLPEKIKHKTLEYVALRSANTWTVAQLDELILMCRYEYTTQLMSETLDSFTKEEMSTDQGQKRFMNLSRAMNTALRDIGILRGSLALTVGQVFGDKRTLGSGSQKELSLRTIATDGNGNITDLNEARARAKQMLLANGVSE
jgi:hypothetical protein